MVLGVGFLTFDYFSSKKVMAYDTINNELFETQNDTVSVTEETTENEGGSPSQSSEQQTSQTVSRYAYIGFLEIPKLGIKKGFLDPDDPDNTVEKNIMVIPTSTFPDKECSHLILAGHSGYGYKAFFKYLYKLEVGDEAIITYKDKTYTYQIKKIYTQPKTGKIAIYRDYTKKGLTLVTCTKDDKTTQTIYIADLIS